MTPLELYNSALDLVGVEAIKAFGEPSKAGRMGNRIYTTSRDSCLSYHFWNFAMEWSTLSEITLPTGVPYEHAFRLPTTCLRVREVNDLSDEEWEVKGKRILLANNDEVTVSYINKETDTSQFSSHFDEALIHKMASKLAYPMVQSVSLKQSFETQARDMLRLAMSLDGQEGSKSQMQKDVFLEARLGRIR